MGSQSSRPLEQMHHESSAGQKRSASIMEESDSNSNGNNNTDNLVRRPKRQRRPDNYDDRNDGTGSPPGSAECSRYYYFSSFLKYFIKHMPGRSARWTVKQISYGFLKALEYKCVEHERKYAYAASEAAASSSLSPPPHGSRSCKNNREDIFRNTNELEENIEALLNLLLLFQSDTDTTILSRGWRILTYLLINGRRDRPLPLLPVEATTASGGNVGQLDQNVQTHFPVQPSTTTTALFPSLSMINQHLPEREDATEELFAIILTAVKESYPRNQKLLHYAGLTAIGAIVGDDERKGKWLFRAGAVPVLSMVMGMHFEHQKIQFLVVSCLILMMREGGADARKMIARHCREPLSASINSCLEVAFLAVYELKKDREALDTLLDGGIIVAITSAAQKSLDNGDLSTAETAMRLLTNFVTDGVAWRFFESCGIMHLACTFLDRHRLRDVVVLELLVLIREAGRHDRFPNTLVVKMVEILSKYMSTSSTTFFACAILLEMLEQDEVLSSSPSSEEETPVQELILSSGAIDCIIDAALTHKDDHSFLSESGIRPLAYLIMRHIWDRRPRNEATNAATSAFGGSSSVAARITNFRGLFRGGNNDIFDPDDDDEEDEEDNDIHAIILDGDNLDENIRDIRIDG